MSKEKIESILFNKTPDIRIRVIEDVDPKEIKEQKTKYPFELFNTVEVFVITSYRNFKFTIPKGYVWNGADIPRYLWRLIGAKTDNNFLLASMLHDYLLEMKVYMINEVLKNQISIKEYRRLTSLIFREKIKKQGTPTIKANVMSWCVDVFQIINRKGWKTAYKNCK